LSLFKLYPSAQAEHLLSFEQVVHPSMRLEHEVHVAFTWI
jgi:hypothetical protein